MKKKKLNEAVSNFKAEMKSALETLYNALNEGQKKQIVKDEKVKALFDKYEVAQ